MTSKEAKKILNEYRNRNYNSTFRDELELAKAIDTILPKYVELESRDTPMKVKSDRSGDFHVCPICEKRRREMYEKDNFCEKCGQRLEM